MLCQSTPLHGPGAPGHRPVAPPASMSGGPVPAEGHHAALTRRAALLLLSAPAALGAAVPDARAQVAEPFCGVLPRAPAWAFSMPWQERLVPYAGGQTWVREVGGGSSGGGLFGLFGAAPKPTKCAPRRGRGSRPSPGARAASSCAAIRCRRAVRDGFWCCAQAAVALHRRRARPGVRVP